MHPAYHHAQPLRIVKLAPMPPAPLPILGEGCLHWASLPDLTIGVSEPLRILEVLVTAGSPLPGLGEGSGVRAGPEIPPYVFFRRRLGASVGPVSEEGPRGITCSSGGGC